MTRPACELVLDFVDAVNQKDWRKIRGLVSPSFLRHSRAGGDICGVDALLSFLEREFHSFPDAHEVCKQHFSKGDMVAVIMEFSGTQAGPLGEFPPTGIFVSAPYIAVYRVENGVIAESWAEWDNLSTLQTLGYMK